MVCSPTTGQGERLVRFQQLLTILILIVSLVFVLWGFWPLGHSVRILQISPDDLSPDPAHGTISPASKVNSVGQLVLQMQPVIRKGESSKIQLTLENDQKGISPSDIRLISHAGHSFEAYRILAEARLEVSGVEVSPSDSLTQSWIPGQPAVFSWNLDSSETGLYQGTVWFTFRFLPIAGGSEIQKTISAQRIEVKSIDLLGWGSPWARFLGGIGIVLCGLSGLAMVFIKKILGGD
jgi:hypothetical protein